MKIRSLICILRGHTPIPHRFSPGGTIVSIYCMHCRRVWRVYE